MSDKWIKQYKQEILKKHEDRIAYWKEHGKLDQLEKYKDYIKQPFIGYSDDEIQQIMTGQNVRQLPKSYYQLLTAMGKRQGVVFNLPFARFDQLLKQTALWNLEQNNKYEKYKVHLPDTAFNFIWGSPHDDDWYFFQVDGNDDPPIYQYCDGYTAFLCVSLTLSKFFLDTFHWQYHLRGWVFEQMYDKVLEVDPYRHAQRENNEDSPPF